MRTIDNGDLDPVTDEAQMQVEAKAMLLMGLICLMQWTYATWFLDVSWGLLYRSVCCFLGK